MENNRHYDYGSIVVGSGLPSKPPYVGRVSLLPAFMSQSDLYQPLDCDNPLLTGTAIADQMAAMPHPLPK